ncbi:hypothetical protein FKM82_015567 [Ascaphus truei]
MSSWDKSASQVLHSTGLSKKILSMEHMQAKIIFLFKLPQGKRRLGDFPKVAECAIVTEIGIQFTNAYFKDRKQSKIHCRIIQICTREREGGGRHFQFSSVSSCMYILKRPYK